MAGSSDKPWVWYQLQGCRATRLQIAQTDIVDDLARKIKHENPRKLGNVDANDITLFANEADKDDLAKALEVDEVIENVRKNGGGISKASALYVHYDQPSTSAASEQQVRQAVREEVHALVLPLYTQAAATQSVHDQRSGFTNQHRQRRREEMRAFYNVDGEPSCVVLSAFIKNDWRLYPQTFDAVAEHIIVDKDVSTARYYNVHVDEPRNGIFLHKAIEVVYQSGKLMILPMPKGLETGVELQILVGNTIREDYVLHTVDKQQSPIGFVVEDALVLLQYKLLHNFRFTMPRAPFMRSLFAKAMMAYSHTDEGFPNPGAQQQMDAFLSHCHQLRVHFDRITPLRTPSMVMTAVIERGAEQDAGMDGCSVTARSSQRSGSSSRSTSREAGEPCHKCARHG